MATTFAELFGAVFPSISDVRSGVDYGPTGANSTGTLVPTGGGGASASEIADAVAAQLSATAIRRIAGTGLLKTDRIVVRGTTWRITMPFAVPAEWGRMEFTARLPGNNSQSRSEVWIRTSNPAASDDGLLVVAKQPASAPAAGSIATQSLDSPQVQLSAVQTALIDPGSYTWDLKVFHDGEVTQQARGRLYVEEDVTRTSQ